MSGLLDLLGEQLGGSTVDEISKRVGVPRDSAEKAMASALPALLGGLAKNANTSPDGALALANALDRDHDGSLLDGLAAMIGGAGAGAASTGGGSEGPSDLPGGAGGGGLGDLLGGMLRGGGGGSGAAASSRAVDGDGILGHVFGQKRAAVESGVAQSSGLDLGKAAQLLKIAAPLVMGALGKMKKQGGLDANGLASLLQQEQAAVETAAPGMQQGGLLSFLDLDHDGDVTNDVAKLGSTLGNGNLLGKLFGR